MKVKKVKEEYLESQNFLNETVDMILSSLEKKIRTGELLRNCQTCGHTLLVKIAGIIKTRENYCIKTRLYCPNCKSKS